MRRRITNYTNIKNHEEHEENQNLKLRTFRASVILLTPHRQLKFILKVTL